MNKNKNTLQDTYVRAVVSYKKRDFKTAELICYKILSIDPNHLDSFSLLATLAAVEGNFNKAKEFLNKALKIQPDNTTVLNNLGTTHIELGNLSEAKNLFETSMKINPKHTNSNYNLGLVYYKMKDLKNAKKYLQKTVELQSNYGVAFFNLANLHVELKEFDKAISCYQKAIEINPKLVGAHNNLGLVFRGQNDFDNAIKCYKKAIELKPSHAVSHHNLAQTYKELGKFSDAIESHKNAIKYEPNNLSHYYFLNELKKDVLDSSLKGKIEKDIKNNKLTKINLAYGNFLLAENESKSKNYEKELSYLIKAHNNFFASKKEKFDLGVKYCFNDVLQIVEGAELSKIDEKKNYEVKPIFIIGVPRCGSTLLEKIIGSGEKVIPLGEETAVLENYVNAKILEKKSLNLGSVKEVRDELFNIYKKRGLISKKHDYIFTDKSLNNFFYLELIKEIYPEAKVINLKRDVLSSIMSIFQHNLTDLAWTHDLEHIFKYFDNYFKIIENFINQNPNFVYELKFEDLINNPEKESKKLMKFCNLPWSKNCLEFYKRKDLISKTASNIQIREAIFKNPSNKYLPYKKFLDKYGKKYSWFN